MNKPAVLSTQGLLIAVVLCCLSSASFAACQQNKISVNCAKTATSVFDQNGLLWTTFVQQGFVYITHSADLGAHHSSPVKVNQTPQKIYTNGENRPKIKLSTKGFVFVSWTEKTPGRFTGDIHFARSINAGKSFENVKTINDDGLPIGHRFDAMTVTPSGLIYIAWLDKRDSTAAQQNSQPYAGISVYYAVSNDQGASFSANKLVAENSCECCRIAIANQGDNNATIMWRQLFAGGVRDHAISTLTPHHRLAVHRATVDEWQTNTCPHHGPDIDNSQPGFSHLTWFSAGKRHKGIYYATFQQHSKTLKNTISVDSSPQASHPNVMQFNNIVWLVWKTYENEQSLIKMRYSTDHGAHWSAANIIASTLGKSDHPLLINNKQQIFLSWLSANEGLRLIPIAKTLPASTP